MGVKLDAILWDAGGNTWRICLDTIGHVMRCYDRVEDMAQIAVARRVGVARGVSHDEPRYYRHALHGAIDDRVLN